MEQALSEDARLLTLKERSRKATEAAGNVGTISVSGVKAMLARMKITHKQTSPYVATHFSDDLLKER